MGLLANSLTASTLFGVRVSEIAGHPRTWLIALQLPCWEEAQTIQGGLQSAPPGLVPALNLRGEAHPGDPAPSCSVPSTPYVIPQAQPEILTSKSMVEVKWSLFGVWGRW